MKGKRRKSLHSVTERANPSASLGAMMLSTYPRRRWKWLEISWEQAGEEHALSETRQLWSEIWWVQDFESSTKQCSTAKLGPV